MSKFRAEKRSQHSLQVDPSRNVTMDDTSHNYWQPDQKAYIFFTWKKYFKFIISNLNQASRKLENSVWKNFKQQTRLLVLAWQTVTSSRGKLGYNRLRKERLSQNVRSVYVSQSFAILNVVVFNFLLIFGTPYCFYERFLSSEVFYMYQQRFWTRRNCLCLLGKGLRLVQRRKSSLDERICSLHEQESWRSFPFDDSKVK